VAEIKKRLLVPVGDRVLDLLVELAAGLIGERDFDLLGFVVCLRALAVFRKVASPACPDA